MHESESGWFFNSWKLEVQQPEHDQSQDQHKRDKDEKQDINRDGELEGVYEVEITEGLVVYYQLISSIWSVCWNGSVI